MQSSAPVVLTLEVILGPDNSSKLSAPDAACERRHSHSVIAPNEQSVPLVFASPHSGEDYPEDFVANARLSRQVLRRSEDAFVDRIFSAAPTFGAPLLKAHFPRVYLDPNREAFELDPTMFDAPLPDYVNARSPRVAAGLGTVARVVANGEEIYRTKLRFAEVRQRIETHYVPYHETLRAMLDATCEKFGCYLLVDCHSMPSVGGPMDADPGSMRLDIVLGDCHGQSCAPAVVHCAEQTLRALGLTVRRNVPYAGGFTTRHYAQPDQCRHALQVEINRALYMDEERITPTPGIERMTQAITKMIDALCSLDPRELKAG
jgi:N-formylglutamate amidohydrolase